MILNLPSPPHRDVERDWAGGFGTASYSPRRDDYGQSGEPILQSFLPYASSALSEAGYEFDVLDCQRLKLNPFQVLSNVKKRSPNVIFSLIGLPSLKKDLELLNRIKEPLPNTLVVGVGTVCRVIPSEVLLKSTIDVVLRGSYPYVSNLTKLVKAFQDSRNFKRVPGVSYATDEKITSTPESPDLNLDEIPPPSYEVLELDGYASFTDINGERYKYVPILGSKGCPYPCLYCPYPLGFGRKWTCRPPKEIVDEIEYLCAIRGIRGFLLRDQSFVMNKKHAINICDEIIQRKLDVAWFCEARVDGITRELLKKMEKAGCKEVHYGVETGDPEIIRIAKPGVNLGTIRKTFRLMKETGLRALAHVILGWPDDSHETIKRTYKFVLDLDPDDVNWNVLTPYPGTKMHEIAQKDSLILTNDWSKYTSHTIVMKTKNLSGSQLYATKNRIIRDFSKQRMKKLLLQLPHGKKQPRLLIDEAKDIIGSYIAHKT